MMSKLSEFETSEHILAAVVTGLASIHNQVVQTYSGRMEVSSSKMQTMVDEHQNQFLKKLNSTGIISYREVSVPRT